MRDKKQAFTLMELMVVVGIIAILMGVLLPALNVVQRTARNTKQKAQLTTIGLAITSFKNDFGDYPESRWTEVEYCGALKLCEALLGWDLMGFHPDSVWSYDGKDASNGDLYEIATDDSYSEQQQEENLKERKGPYLESGATTAFKLKDLFADPDPLFPERYVLCDVFGVKRITVSTGETVMAGTPILYYKANISSKRFKTGDFPDDQIYSDRDNRPFTTFLENLKSKNKTAPTHRLGVPSGSYENFYEFIRDKRIDPDTKNWPYNPDSYILISAGADGEYGTYDDITNFK